MQNPSGVYKRKNIILIIIIVVVFIVVKLAAFFTPDKVIGKYRPVDSFRDTKNLILTNHAKCRMNCRHITVDEIKEVLHEGSENYSKDDQGNKVDKTYALEGYSSEHQHIRVVVAPKSDGVVVITCIDLDKDWPCNCN